MFDFGGLLSGADAARARAGGRRPSTSDASDDAAGGADLVAALRDDVARSRHEAAVLRDELRDLAGADERARQQLAVLKDTIRELERGQKRTETSTQHAQYVKNVVVQFALARGAPPVQRKLLPVLTTLLMLSPDEVAAVEATLT